MIAVALWFLATLDAAFTGYREAAGRDALINKRLYYRRAMVRGALCGQLAVAIAGVVLLLTLQFTPDREALLRDYERAGARLLIVYTPYAMIILLAFLIRALPSVDLRSITSTVIFGPFTLIRPFVAVAGLVYGVIGAPRVETVAVGLLVLVMMLTLEKILNVFRRLREAPIVSEARP